MGRSCWHRYAMRVHFVRVVRSYEGCRYAQPLATGWDGSAIYPNARAHLARTLGTPDRRSAWPFFRRFRMFLGPRKAPLPTREREASFYKASRRNTLKPLPTRARSVLECVRQA